MDPNAAMPQTKRDIQAALSAAGINPLKRYGQHFLIDGNLMRKLVAADEPKAQDTVLEVGPGTGSLTGLLLQSAGHVVAVEIDKGLHAILRAKFAGNDKLTLLHRDVLATKSRIAPEVLGALREWHERLGGRLRMIANLPYQVATPLVMELVTGDLPISPLVFTVQKEVGDRLMAPAGGKDYGPISIIVQALGRIERVAHVPPEAFWPVPKVDSSMLRIDVERERLRPAVRTWLARLVHGCFQHRRKTLKSNLRDLLDDAMYARVEADGRWDLADRPERLDVAGWVALAEATAEGSGPHS